MATTVKKKKQLKIKLTRGIAKADTRQTKVLTALGLRKSQQEVEHDASPTIMGMINKVQHLVTVTENK